VGLGPWLSLIHFYAHAEASIPTFGSLYGHVTPIRRLIESRPVRVNRFACISPSRVLAGPGDAGLDASPSYAQLAMTEVVTPRLEDACPGVHHRHRTIVSGLPVGGHRRGGPHGPGNRHPADPVGLTGLDSCSTRCALDRDGVGATGRMDVLVSPPVRPRRDHRLLAGRVVLEAAGHGSPGGGGAEAGEPRAAPADSVARGSRPAHRPNRADRHDYSQ